MSKEYAYIVECGKIEKMEIVNYTPKGFRVRFERSGQTTFKPFKRRSPDHIAGAIFNTSYAVTEKHEAIELAKKQIEDYWSWSRSHICKANKLWDVLND
ncbi:MAG: hypothetical protein KZQ83_14745 [gamma proteobacterium symbiont of Taylorina sp.]|nr:hypothetical protein [gamma proteobacterium symbiont of Taylorina sp.]